MNRIRQLAIDGLSLLTRNAFQGTALICLHRVVPDHEKSPLSIPRDLEITPQFLKVIVSTMREEGYQFVPLERALETIKTKPRTRYCALTFDDGYLDNLTYAYPILCELDVPFTIYVTSSFINDVVEPWWYRLQRVLSTSHHVRIPSPTGHITIAPGESKQRDRYYTETYQEIKLLSQVDRENRIEELAAINSDALKKSNPVPFLRNTDLNTLSESGLVNIGAHTVSHPNLTLLNPHNIEQEMRVGREAVEEWIGRPVLDFSYPHGKTNFEVAHTARKLVFRSAATTRAGMIRKKTPSPYLIPRFCIGGESENPRQLTRAFRGVYLKSWQ